MHEISNDTIIFHVTSYGIYIYMIRDVQTGFSVESRISGEAMQF